MEQPKNPEQPKLEELTSIAEELLAIATPYDSGEAKISSNLIKEVAKDAVQRFIRDHHQSLGQGAPKPRSILTPDQITALSKRANLSYETGKHLEPNERINPSLRKDQQFLETLLMRSLWHRRHELATELTKSMESAQAILEEEDSKEQEKPVITSLQELYDYFEANHEEIGVDSFMKRLNEVTLNLDEESQKELKRIEMSIVRDGTAQKRTAEDSISTYLSQRAGEKARRKEDQRRKEVEKAKEKAMQAKLERQEDPRAAQEARQKQELLANTLAPVIGYIEELEDPVERAVFIQDYVNEHEQDIRASLPESFNQYDTEQLSVQILFAHKAMYPDSAKPKEAPKKQGFFKKLFGWFRK